MNFSSLRIGFRPIQLVGNLFQVPQSSLRTISFGELERLQLVAETTVRNYYKDIDRRDLKSAVFGFFHKRAMYFRNDTALNGLSSKADSIRCFYQKERKINGQHEVTQMIVTNLDEFKRLFQEKTNSHNLPNILRNHLKPNLLPVYVKGTFAGEHTDNGKKEPLSLNYQDFFLIDPSQGGKVCFRQSIVTDDSGKLLKV